jgi:hypothetical protein
MLDILSKRWIAGGAYSPHVLWVIQVFHRKYSWFIIENFIPRLFAEVVSEKNKTSGQMIKAEKYDSWSIATKIEFLNFVGKIDTKKYEFLKNYNNKRNDFIHKGKTIIGSDSEKLYDFSFNIVKNEINKKLKEKM